MSAFPDSGHTTSNAKRTNQDKCDAHLEEREDKDVIAAADEAVQKEAVARWENEGGLPKPPTKRA